MTTIHIIESAEERERIKSMFRSLIKDIHNGIDESLVESGSIVYDIVDGGDPELGWMVYDFRGKDARCYSVSEQDLAGLVNELPSHVFPF